MSGCGSCSPPTLATNTRPAAASRPRWPRGSCAARTERPPAGTVRQPRWPTRRGQFQPATTSQPGMSSRCSTAAPRELRTETRRQAENARSQAGTWSPRWTGQDSGLWWPPWPSQPRSTSWWARAGGSRSLRFSTDTSEGRDTRRTGVGNINGFTSTSRPDWHQWPVRIRSHPAADALRDPTSHTESPSDLSTRRSPPTACRQQAYEIGRGTRDTTSGRRTLPLQVRGHHQSLESRRSASTTPSSSAYSQDPGRKTTPPNLTTCPSSPVPPPQARAGKTRRARTPTGRRFRNGVSRTAPLTTIPTHLFSTASFPRLSPTSAGLSIPLPEITRTRPFPGRSRISRTRELSSSTETVWISPEKIGFPKLIKAGSRICRSPLYSSHRSAVEKPVTIPSTFTVTPNFDRTNYRCENVTQASMPGNR